MPACASTPRNGAKLLYMHLFLNTRPQGRYLLCLTVGSITYSCQRAKELPQSRHMQSLAAGPQWLLMARDDWHANSTGSGIAARYQQCTKKLTYSFRCSMATYGAVRRSIVLSRPPEGVHLQTSQSARINCAQQVSAPKCFSNQCHRLTIKKYSVVM